MGILAALTEAVALNGQQVRETVEVDVIGVSLRARDTSGKPVTALGRDDLWLRVDGMPVSIETFDPVPLDSGEAETNVPDPRPDRVGRGENAPVAPSLPRYFAILADVGETTSFDMRDSYDQVIAFLRAPASAGDRFLVAQFSGGDLSIEQTWTGESAEAARQVSKLRSRLSIERLPSAGTLQRSQGRGDPPPLVWIEKYRSRLRQALLELISLFPQGSGRRALVLVTGGTALLRPGDLAQALYGSPTAASTDGTRLRNSKFAAGRGESAVERTDREQTAFELWDRALSDAEGGPTRDDVVRRATERDVALVPVAAEALGRSLTGADSRISSATAAGNARLDVRLALGQVMTSMAEDTGGEAILAPQKLAGRLAAVGGKGFFTLTFRDPYPGTHVRHQLEITSNREGLHLEYRRAYRIPTDDDRLVDSVMAQLVTSDPAGGPLHVAAAVSPGQGSKGQPVTRLTFEYIAPAERESVQNREVEVIAVGKDGDGGLTRPIRWVGTATRSDRMDAYMAYIDLGTPPGIYRWSIGVRDLLTSLTSFSLAGP